MASGWNENQAGEAGVTAGPAVQRELCFTEWDWKGDAPCPPKIWELLSEVLAFVTVHLCWCFHPADVFIEISAAAAALLCLCLHRVREAAMTSLMEVTLLLVQNEAELIHANMYAMFCPVSQLLELHPPFPAGVQCLHSLCSSFIECGRTLIKVHQAHAHREDVAVAFQRENLVGSTWVAIPP